METQREYQKRELQSFLNQQYSYFDNVQDFADNLAAMDIYEQVTWIENGSYGAGACLTLQKEFNGLTDRMNKRARIGQIALHAFYGKPFIHWRKLPVEVQKKINSAVDKWMEKEKDWAIELIK
jgi:hypothetical protein